MPLQQTSKNCWRWGEKGKVYCGKDAKKKAMKQGYAIDKDKFMAEATEEDIMSIASLGDKIRYHLLRLSALANKIEGDKEDET